MYRSSDEANVGTPTKKLRFRGDLNFHSRIETLNDDDNNSKRPNTSGFVGKQQLPQQPQQQHQQHPLQQQQQQQQQQKEKDKKDEQTDGCRERPSFMDFFKVEMTRGYMLEHDEERYSARRQKIYSFMRIPRDLERFMVYGIMQCADSFLYIHTFLPVRFLMAVWGLLSRPIASCLGLRRRSQRLLSPAEICDLLKGAIWFACTVVMLSVDTNRIYHIIKSQSTIKLYILYNMLEVGDRLLSAFGQDTIDALFWTATEPKNSKRQHFGLATHIFFAMMYVLLHSILIMFQATSLNVAMNSNNKGLLTIMMSNNFVELKGSVFKKFDKNNLFQLACSDVRERFHLSVLHFIVMIQTMKEFDWSLTQFYEMLPDLALVLLTEIVIDWIKHAFITRFNELPECIYREYTTSLAYDMTQTRQKHAFSDHSDLVARRMGFIPFPLGVVLIKAVYSAVSFNNGAAWVLFGLAYFFVLGLRITLTICALGKACKLMKEHQEEKSNSTPTSMTNMPPVVAGAAAGLATTTSSTSMLGTNVLPTTPRTQRTEVASSPRQPPTTNTQQQQQALDSVFLASIAAQSTSTPKTTKSPSLHTNDVELDVTHSLELGATALFSNSDVDLDDVCLNEKVLEPGSNAPAFVELELARSEPDLSQQPALDDCLGGATAQESSTNTHDAQTAGGGSVDRNTVPKRTHKRSESEPSMQSIVGDSDA